MTARPVGELEPLTRHIGIRIHGVSPFQVHPDELRGLVHQHLVVIFSGTDLDDAGQADLVSRIGEPYLHPFERVRGITTPEVWHFIDDETRPPDRDSWHTDESFSADPPSMATLRCVQPAERGGDTLWSSMYAAFDSLSETMQSIIGTLSAQHRGPWSGASDNPGSEFVAALREHFPGTPHPVVGTHPHTQLRYLFVNRGLTSHVCEMTPSESSALLGVLFAQAESPNWQYRHRWEQGDLAIWDERATQHFATSDHYPARREMARLLIV